jgi:hypothetical protein
MGWYLEVSLLEGKWEDIPQGLKPPSIAVK